MSAYRKLAAPIVSAEVLGIVLAALVAGAAAQTAPARGTVAGGAKPGMTQRVYMHLPDGRTANLYTLNNGNGLVVAITDYGGIVISIMAPDRKGKPADIVLGFDDPFGYLNNTNFFGALIGRYGNRIAKGKFSLDGHTYSLPLNNNGNSLHGGDQGFNTKLWQAREVSTPAGAPALQLRYVSKDGEEGYPGNLSVQVTYTLTPSGDLQLDYYATTDKDTVVNLTSHTYFNLAGRGRGDILNHVLTLHAARFTPIDDTLIPTGELRSVKGTPFDFTSPTPIGMHIGERDTQIQYGAGYDHNFVLDGSATGNVALAAELYEPDSGRKVEIFTNQPGIQFYSGNYLSPVHCGLALETQHFPDSPNHPNFPSTELKPGQQYSSRTIYRFSVR